MPEQRRLVTILFAEVADRLLATPDRSGLASGHTRQHHHFTGCGTSCAATTWRYAVFAAIRASRGSNVIGWLTLSLRGDLSSMKPN